MRIVFVIISLLWSLSNTKTNAQIANANIVVNIINIPNNDGQVLVSLHDKAKDFPKKAILKRTAEIIEGVAVVSFPDMEYGNYAITVIHDENKNGKLDFNLLHIPKENGAASNNAKGFMGPPKYEDAMFEVKSKEVSMDIQMTKIHSNMSKE